MKSLAILLMSSSLLIASPVFAKLKFDENRQQQRMALFQQIPEEKREIIKALMQKLKAQHQGQREKVKSLREESKSILLADTFDAAAFQKNASELHQLKSNLHATRTNLIIDIASQLTAEERKIVAEFFKMRGPRH